VTHLEVSRLKKPVLHLDVSGLQEPVLFLDLSTLQRPVLHLDVSSTPQGPELYQGTWTNLDIRDLCYGTSGRI
jgi:hypothetical protein